MPIYKLKLVREKVSDEQARPIVNAETAVDYLKRHCFQKDQMWRETAWAVLLDRQKQPTGHFLVGVGGFNTCPIDAKLVTTMAIEANADSVLLAHSHPTIAKPSPKDIEETNKLHKALTCVGIQLLDHVIVSDDAFFSFLEEKQTTIAVAKSA